MSRRGPTPRTGRLFAESASPAGPWGRSGPNVTSNALFREAAMNDQEILWISSWVVAMILLMGIWLALWD